MVRAHGGSAAEANVAGNLPLHLAAAGGAGPDVVGVILRAHPPGKDRTNVAGQR